MSKNYTNEEFEFYLAMVTDNDNFSAGLVRLFLKSDPPNRMRLRNAFPNMDEVVFLYQNKSGYWEDLQKRIGLTKKHQA